MILFDRAAIARGVLISLAMGATAAAAQRFTVEGVRALDLSQGAAVQVP